MATIENRPEGYTGNMFVNMARTHQTEFGGVIGDWKYDPKTRTYIPTDERSDEEPERIKEEKNEENISA